MELGEEPGGHLTLPALEASGPLAAWTAAYAEVRDLISWILALILVPLCLRAERWLLSSRRERIPQITMPLHSIHVISILNILVFDYMSYIRLF